jgi:hypothetical protein
VGLLRGVLAQAPFVGAIIFAAAVQPAGRQSAPSGQLPLLTRLESIRQLSQDESARRYPVRVRGVVTHFDEMAANGLIVHDGSVGQYVLVPTSTEGLAVWRSLRSGDDIEIEGTTVRGGFAPNLEAAVIRKLGRAALPKARRVTYSTLLTGRNDCDFVELEGVLQRAWRSSDPQHHPLFAELAVEGGVVRASFWDYSPEDAARLTDARVRIRGNIGTIFGHTEQLRGLSLFGGRTADIEVLEPAPDPFALPLRPIRSIFNFSLEGEVSRRVRVRGVVTAQISGRAVEMNDFTSTTSFKYNRLGLYVKDGTSGARIEMEEAPKARPGDVVDVAGFPAVTPGKPILRNAVVRVIGTDRKPVPVELSTTNAITPESDAELVRVLGEVLSVVTTPAERVLVLKMGETVFDAGFEKSEAGDKLQQIRPGSLVSVTGVYSYQWGPPPSFRLFLRSPDDVAVLRAAPWWTMRHTAVMVVMLAIAAAVSGLWMRAMTNRKRQQYQAVLTERNRVARELHDTLEQGLTGLTLQLEAVSATLQSSPEMARRSLGDAAIGHGPAVAGARVGRPARRPHPARPSDDAGHVHQRGSSRRGAAAAPRRVAGAPPPPDRPRSADQRAQARQPDPHRHRAAVPQHRNRARGARRRPRDRRAGAADERGPFRPARRARAGGQTRRQPGHPEPARPRHQTRRDHSASPATRSGGVT